MGDKLCGGNGDSARRRDRADCRQGRIEDRMKEITGIHHVTCISGDAQENLDFYTSVLGMRLVLEQPNLDDPNSVHLFFETGPGQFIAYFVPKPGKPIEGSVKSGALAHIALNLDGDLDDAMALLRVVVEHIPQADASRVAVTTTSCCC